MAFYKCWPTSTIEKRDDPVKDPNSSVPAGFVHDDHFGMFFLRFTSKDPDELANFAFNGEYFTPETYKVWPGWVCKFYT